MNLTSLGQRARTAARTLAQASTAQKNAALLALAERLIQDSAEILAANRDDLEASRAAGLSPDLIDRLLLDPTRLEAISADLRTVVELPRPVCEAVDPKTLP